MKTKMLLKILLLLILTGCLVWVLSNFESRALYFPLRTLEAGPSAYGLPFEDVFFETTDGQKLNGWFVPAPESAGTVLFCHGNAGNISHRAEKILFFHRLGLNVFIFDYRGYGKSQGRPSEDGLYRDVDAAYQYLMRRGIKPQEIIGFGESLGGAVIIDLAARQPMRTVIVEGAFTSVKDMAAVHYPFIPQQMLRDRFNSKQKITVIKIPKLVIHSQDDEIVPFRMGESLFEAAQPPKEFLKIQGGHNEAPFESQKILEDKIRDFLSKISQ